MLFLSLKQQGCWHRDSKAVVTPARFIDQKGNMCGIIAYSGFRDSKKVLLKGLENIQYRGYDSMGLLVAGPSGFKRVRSVGGLQQLKKTLKKEAEEKLSGSYGMAHSRWATHGAPLEKNAHPHKAGPFYIVHNGIIENAEALKAGLKGPFLSNTDSEVIAHSLWHAYQKSPCIKSAIFDTISKIKGEYAIVLMSEEHPNELWAFKKGPSLLVGMGEREVLVCSDRQGILPWTNKVMFLKDGEMAHIQTGQPSEPFRHPSPPTDDTKEPTDDTQNPVHIQIYSAKQEKINPTGFVQSATLEDSRATDQNMKHKGFHKHKPTGFVLLDQKAEQAERGDWPCYMLKEIHEQADCVSKLIQTYTHAGHLRFQDKLLSDFLEQVVQAGRLNIVACGSSYYSAIFGKYVIEKFSRIFVEADMASEFRYRSPVLNKTPLLLISQSGETADTLAVLKMAKKLAQPVLSLCNVAHSSLDRGADLSLYMMAGAEKAVASTKAFSATLTTLFLLALCLAKHKKLLLEKEETKWVQSLSALPNHIKTVLSFQSEYKVLAQQLRSLKSFIYVGRDIYYPLALEGALKIKELTYRHAEAYPAGELKHGPLALVDENIAIVGIAPQSHIYTKTQANLEEVRCRGGKLIIIGTEGKQDWHSVSDFFLPLPAVNAYLSAILCAIPLQLMAYQTACALGHNVDQPRNLAKSVTVE